MKIPITVLLFTYACFCLTAQEAGIPDWYMEYTKNRAGTWMADNRQYQSDEEPMDAYAMEWQLGPLGNELYGKLYGLVDGEPQGTYWSFHQYWDPHTREVVVLQIGTDGTLCKGNLHKQGDTTELVQVFTSPAGQSRKEGHRTITIDDTTETGTSFSINAQGDWIARRTYTWKKT